MAGYKCRVGKGCAAIFGRGYAERMGFIPRKRNVMYECVYMVERWWVINWFLYDWVSRFDAGYIMI